MTPDDELRAFATAVRDQHDPSKQEGNTYDRCAACSYTRHPCDPFDLASSVLDLLDREPRFLGWWWDNVRHGVVHDHPDPLPRNWSVASHRLCVPVYR